MTAPMMPGECHPALTEFADDVRTAPPTVDPVLIAAPPRTDHTLSLDVDLSVPSFRTLALRRERAYHVFLPGYGAYLWDVWVDEYGRQIAGEHARWEAHPLASTLPEWNPGPTFRVGPDGRWWRVNELAAADYDRTVVREALSDQAGCAICVGTGTDYLGRPCRIHGRDLL